MKFTKSLFTLITLFFLSFAAYASETLTLDPMHTYVLWRISHFGFSTQAGKWYISSGSLVLDKEKPDNSKVNVTIQVANVVTGIPELDKHLKEKLFFNAEKFPTAIFVSNKVVAGIDNTAKVYGTLTLHGVSKPVVLDVKLNKSGISPITNKMTYGFAATTKINRSDFGINTLVPGLGDEVKLNIEAEASEAKK